MLALQGLRQLADLDLFEVSGPTAEALDEAIRGMTNLHRLHVSACRGVTAGSGLNAYRFQSCLRSTCWPCEQHASCKWNSRPSFPADLGGALIHCVCLQEESRSAACKAPSLRSLACLPRMRQLAVRQARPRQGLEGLTNLQALVELQALDLRGATVTNSIMQRLSALSALTQVRRCCSEAHCSSAQRCVCGCQGPPGLCNTQGFTGFACRFRLPWSALQLRVPGAALVTDQGFEALAGLTALRELDVSCWTVRGSYCGSWLPCLVKCVALAAAMHWLLRCTRPGCSGADV